MPKAVSAIDSSRAFSPIYAQDSVHDRVHCRIVGAFRNEDEGTYSTKDNKGVYSNGGTYNYEDNGVIMKIFITVITSIIIITIIIKLLLIMHIYKTCKWRKAEENTTNNYSHCNTKQPKKIYTQDHLY